MEMELDKGKQIQRYDLHRHPLVLVEAQGDEKEKADCSVCGELISESDSRFTCHLHCNFHLHPQCSQLPDSIIPHPFHPQHDGLYFESHPELYAEKRACALCKEKCKLLFYSCSGWCRFCLCVKCVLSSSHLIIDSENMSEYELPFIFLKSHKDELKRAHCSWCQHSCIGPFYVSVGCKVILHQNCFLNLPTEMGLPCHRSHPLFLQFQTNSFFCEICQKDDADGDKLLYRCLACKFDIHLECSPHRPIIEANTYHDHPFTMLCRNDSSFICDGCGTDGKFVSYICPPCHLQVHKTCTLLPPKIKAARHDHVLLHKYFLEKGEVGDCQICFKRVKKEYGSYSCWKEDCNFVVHAKCVLEDDSLYHIIDQENEGVDDDATESSITVIKANELGVATEVRHFNHDHNLVLEDKMTEHDDRACDGCMLSICTPFYDCSRCNFFLHKTCAELPKTKHHWFQLPAMKLEASGNWEWCRLCDRLCSGLFYRGSGGRMFCLRCAAIPYVIKHEWHQHLVFFDPKCSGCGLDHPYFGSLFRCKECSFSLDFACLTLPLEVGHKCDDHLMKLAYHDGNDDSEQLYCDICEEKRDPDRWYYSCSTCDNSVHSKCVLGKYPFVKDGATLDRSYYNHNHHHDCLSYVRKVVEGYPYCSGCGKPCQDEVFKCTQCNYIAHFDCWWR